MLVRIKLGPCLLLAAAVSFAAAGCGSPDYGPTLKVSPVTGKVTYGGDPLADAAVTLHLLSEAPAGFAGAGGKTDAQGNFEIMTGTQKGAPAGNYKLTVSKLVGPDGNAVKDDLESGLDLPQLVASGTAKELVPAVYTDQAQSPVDVIVKAGSATSDVKVEIPKS